jgi:uncharacterized membrane protein required for colicin V production
MLAPLAPPLPPGSTAEIHFGLLGGLRWIDALGLALVLLFLLFGALRGLWWQIVRFLGIVAVVAVARALAPRVTPLLGGILPGVTARFANGIAWILVSTAGMLVVSLLARLGKKTLEAVKLGTVDRIGGALAGLASGVVLHATILVILCQVGSTAWASSTLEGTKSEALLDVIEDRFPAVLDVHAADSIRNLREKRRDRESRR